MKNKLVSLGGIFLVLVCLSVILYSYNDHKKDTEKILAAEKNLHQLLRLSESIDSDVLRLLNFRMDNYDSLAEKVKQLHFNQKYLTAKNKSATVNLNISGIKEHIAQYIKISEKKLQYLEHIKSGFASYQATLFYIPTITKQLKESENTDIKEKISTMFALLLNYNLVNDALINNVLQQQIKTLRSIELETQSKILMDKLLVHVDTNLIFQQKLQNLYNNYKKQDVIIHLKWIEEQLEDSLQVKTETSYRANIIFLFCIALLLSGLLFALHHYKLERSKALHRRDMFHDAIESINESFTIYDKDDKLLIWNSKFEQLYPKLKGFLKPGISYQQLIEEAIKQEQFDYGELSAEEVKQILLVSHRETLKNILETISGGKYYLSNNSRTISGGIASVHIDITERQKMESHLLELSRAVEQSPATVVITDIEGCITYVNPKFEQMTGYTADEVMGKNPSILKSGHTSATDYKEMWETIHSGKEWTGTFCNRKKSGELFWEQAIISAIRDNSNKIIAYLAIKEDITTHKSNEEQLRMSAMVFETSSEAIIVTDSKNRIKLVNPSFEKITGYTAAEVMGKNPDVLNSGEHEQGFYNNMWNTLYTTGRWKGEIWNRRKNGEVFPEWLSIAVVKDEESNIVEYVAVFSDISERKKAEDKIHWQANFDHLTHLPNRSLFIDRLKQLISSYKREKKYFALLFIDLDRFKVVNDTLGHNAGDKLLQMVAHRLQQNLSEMDTIARFGGDEFTILLPRIKSAQGAAHAAERIITLLSQPFIINGAEVLIGCTIGITVYPDDAANETLLIRNADMAMYHAKEAGRNSYHFYTESMNEKMLSRMKLEKDLRYAISNNEFFLEYQPVVNAQTQQVVGAEALVRWNHPDHGRLGPDKFISIAEDTGVIKQLGEWVLNEALSQLSHWHKNSYTNMYVAVNVSSAQRLLGLTADVVQKSLDKNKLNGKYLTLEITESLLMDHTEESLTWLKSLKKTGLNLSIDDFGTGFSSLSYLHRFPMDTLKIDKSFIDDALKVTKTAKLVESIILLAHNFGLSVVAEGVEEEKQQIFLHQMGCNYIQGYYYSKPISGQDFLNFIQSKRESENV